MVLAGIVALLTEYGWPLNEKVGNRIYPVLLPEKTAMPAVSYQIVSWTSEPGFQTAGMQKVRVQFDCFGDTYKQATNVREDMIKLLVGMQGENLDDGHFLQNTELVQSIDFYEQDARQFRCALELKFLFTFLS